MRKGTARGQVILDVRVVERGTVVLNRLWFGTHRCLAVLARRRRRRAQPARPRRLGRRPASSTRRHGDIAGARDQWATELRAADPSLLGTRLGRERARSRSSTAARPTGSAAIRATSEPRDLRAFPYRRFGGRAGVTYDVTALSRLVGEPARRVDRRRRSRSRRPQTLPDGRTIALDLHLDPGASRVVTAGLRVRSRHPPRSDPAARGRPPHGQRRARHRRCSAAATSSRRCSRRYEHYWPLFREHARDRAQARRRRRDRRRAAVRSHPHRRRQPHADAARARARAVGGGAARHPRHAPRQADRTATSAAARRSSTRSQLFRGTGKNRVYGGDLFFGAGLWGLAETRGSARARHAASATRCRSTSTSTPASGSTPTRRLRADDRQRAGTAAVTRDRDHRGDASRSAWRPPGRATPRMPPEVQRMRFVERGDAPARHRRRSRKLFDQAAYEALDSGFTSTVRDPDLDLPAGLDRPGRVRR